MHFLRVAIAAFFSFLAACLVKLPSHNFDAGVGGMVSGADGPIRGALVRWQGARECTHTDAQGRFRLAGPPSSRWLTASKPGHPIAVGSARQPHLYLPAIPHDDNDDYAWIDPSPNLDRPVQCGNCHAQIHEEWARSPHGNSAQNRKFLQMFAGDQPRPEPGRAEPRQGPGSDAATLWNLRAEYPLGSGVCAACHAPTLVSPDLAYDIRQAQGVDRHGVHCDYCHKIADAPTDKLGTRFGRDGYRLARPQRTEQLFFGPLDDAVRAGETFVYAPFYQESRYCASCHEGVIFGVHVYGTYSEWLASPAKEQGQQCQHCHMAPTGAMTNFAPGKGGVRRDPRTLASHDFPGGTSEMLKQSLDVQASAERRGQYVAVAVTIQARNVGHRVPTGFIDRHLILVVEAVDEHGDLAPVREGPRLPPRAGPKFAGRPGWIFGKQHLDDQGRPLPFWRAAHELLDTRLTPEETDRRHFRFAANAATVRVRLVYRRFWAEVASSRSWADNEVLLHDQLITP